MNSDRHGRSGARWLLMLGLSWLASCAGWEVRHESALVKAPADEAWSATLELLRDNEFKITQQDNSRHELKAMRDKVLRVIADSKTRPTTEVERHQIDLRILPIGDNRSTVEVIYRIDKLVVAEAAFRLLGAVKDRVAIGASGVTGGPPLR